MYLEGNVSLLVEKEKNGHLVSGDLQYVTLHLKHSCT